MLAVSKWEFFLSTKVHPKKTKNVVNGTVFFFLEGGGEDLVS